MKKWWAADIILVSHVSDSNESLYQENIVLVQAETRDQAEEIAVSEGREMEVSYMNQSNQEVRLLYEGVLDVQELISASLEDRAVVFARYLRKSELDSLRTKL